MTSEELELAKSHIRQCADAICRAADGIDQMDEHGITSVTYTVRQLQIALRHVVAACEPLIREIDR
jgi:hypothetical protein